MYMSVKEIHKQNADSTHGNLEFQLQQVFNYFWSKRFGPRFV